LKAGIFSEVTDVYIPRIFMFYFGFNWHITLYISVDAVESWALLIVAWVGLCLWQSPKHHCNNNENCWTESEPDTNFMPDVHLQILFSQRIQCLHTHYIFKEALFVFSFTIRPCSSSFVCSC
jgi:hypothetical protein